MKLKIGDEVLVVAGKDKGKKGKVEKVLPTMAKVVVAGVNMYKRNVKARGQVRQSGIVDIVKPLPVANVSFVCPKCHLPARVGYQTKRDKKVKERICKKCNQVID